MSAVSQLQVETCIKEYIDPYLESDLVSANVVKNIQIDNGNVVISIQLGFPAQGYFDQLKNNITEKVKTIAGVENVTVAL